MCGLATIAVAVPRWVPSPPHRRRSAASGAYPEACLSFLSVSVLWSLCPLALPLFALLCSPSSFYPALLSVSLSLLLSSPSTPPLVPSHLSLLFFLFSGPAAPRYEGVLWWEVGDPRPWPPYICAWLLPHPLGRSLPTVMGWPG